MKATQVTQKKVTQKKKKVTQKATTLIPHNPWFSSSRAACFEQLMQIAGSEAREELQKSALRFELFGAMKRFDIVGPDGVLVPEHCDDFIKESLVRLAEDFVSLDAVDEIREATARLLVLISKMDMPEVLRAPDDDEW